MSDVGQAYWELREVVEKQARTRKTIDKELLQQLLLIKTNTENIYNTDAVYLKKYNGAMHDLLHTLNCYGGYNNRGWLAFCRLSNWFDIVKALQAIDDKEGTRHYWKLLDYLDHVTPGLHHYGANGYDATAREKRIASRLHSRYSRALDITEGS